MSATLKDSLMFHDIRDILKEPSHKYEAEFTYEIRLHTKNKDLDYRDGVSVSGITTYRDYVGNMSDYIEVKVLLLLGTYVYDVYEYLNNIEVTLYRNRQGKDGEKDILVTERYKAVFLLERNINLPTITRTPRENLDQELPVTLTLQLIDRSSETLRIKTLQGSFDSKLTPVNADMNVGSFLKSMISDQVDKVLIEGKSVIDKIDIEPVHNVDPLKGVILPSGTRLVELPEFLQTKSGGVYTSGIGNYIQRYSSSLLEWGKVFFVYSLYDASKWHKASRKIIFYSPPVSSHSSSDNTYKITDGILKVLVDTVTGLHDTKESIVMSTGIGFRSSNSNSVMKKPVIVTEEGPIFTREKLTTEIINNPREDGLNFAPVKPMRGNHFTDTTEVLSKIGKYVRLKAYNQDLDYFYPGAPCKVVFEGTDGSINELYGVIHRVRENLEHPSINLTNMLSSSKVRLASQVEFEVYITE